MKSNNQGFTLVELTVVLAIMAILAVLTAPNMVEDLNSRRASLTAQETQTLLDAARSYRSKNGSWPGNAVCSNAVTVLRTTAPPMLNGAYTFNKYNSPISTSCTANTFSVDQNIIDDWDGAVSNLLPGTLVVDASTNLIRSTIGIPGSEAALDGKLSRVATGNAELNRMRTTLLLGGNDISEVRNLEASGKVTAGSLDSRGLAVIGGLLDAQGESQFSGDATFNANVRLSRVSYVNGACTTGSIGRDSVGNILSCQSGTWQGLFSWTYRDVTVQRAFGVTYTNDTGTPMFVSIIGSSANNTGQHFIYGHVNGVAIQQAAVNDAHPVYGWVNKPASLSFLVPVGARYMIRNSGGASLTAWHEVH